MKNNKMLVIGFMVFLILALLGGTGYLYIVEGRVDFGLLAGAALLVSTIIRYNRKLTPTSDAASKAPSLKTLEKSYQEYLTNVFEDKSQTRWQLLKALQQFQISENMQAFQNLEKLLPEARNDHEKAALNFFMGLCADEDGIFDIAVHCYQSTIHYQPEFPSVHSNLGLVYTKMKRYPEALEVLKEAVELSPGIINPYINLADLYVKMNDGDKALEVAEKGLAIDPKHLLCIQKVAMAYAVKGNREKCFENIKVMTDLGYQKTDKMTILCNRILDNDPTLWN